MSDMVPSRLPGSALQPTPLAPGTTSLPSGRTVTASAQGGGEQIEIRSPAGDLELRIALTPDGPVLQLRGVKLEIDSTDSVAVRCKDFEIAATDSVRLTAARDVEVRAQGELKVKTQGQMHIDGEVINLNGGDRSDYPDGRPGWTPPPVPGLPEMPTLPTHHEPGCDCGHDHH
ncbi:MAG: hypothetical protein GC200_04385 [Tepidisphaera sp.]|nr:hypothetical protein [Tepidisphaera sp.]